MRPMLKSASSLLTLWVGAAALMHAPPSLAQDTARPVYRCPGPPVLYTDAISADEARERNCRIIDGAPLTVMQTPRRPAPAHSR